VEFRIFGASPIVLVATVDEEKTMTKVVRVKSPGGVEQFEIAEIELPPPAADEVRIRQTAIGVNFVDIYQRSGLYPMPPANIPGVEGVGVIAAVGANVTSVRPGDRIAYAGAPVGAYAAERNLPAWRVVRLPDELSDEAVASSFVKGITAHMLLDRVYPVVSGTTLLVHSAAGGLGQLLTRWATHRGATVIGTVGSQAKAAIARQAGAAHIIVGRDADFAQAVADFTGKRGVDVAYDGVGGATLAKTLACVRPFGVAASVGQAAGPIPPVDVGDLGPRRSLSLARPSVMAYLNETAAYRAATEAVLEGIQSGILRVSGQSYPLSEAARAHADLEAGSTSGALYLRP
jgi:NADPH2:quinone reductase